MSQCPPFAATTTLMAGSKTMENLRMKSGSMVGYSLALVAFRLSMFL